MIVINVNNNNNYKIDQFFFYEFLAPTSRSANNYHPIEHYKFLYLAIIFFREFGFTSGHRQLVTGYTVGVTKVVLQGATCSESATSLNECATLVWGEHECLDSERVAIVCGKNISQGSQC